jgi:hypothetical protein
MIAKSLSHRKFAASSQHSAEKPWSAGTLSWQTARVKGLSRLQPNVKHRDEEALLGTMGRST